MKNTINKPLNFLVINLNRYIMKRIIVSLICSILISCMSYAGYFRYFNLSTTSGGESDSDTYMVGDTYDFFLGVEAYSNGGGSSGSAQGYGNIYDTSTHVSDWIDETTYSEFIDVNNWFLDRYAYKVVLGGSVYAEAGQGKTSWVKVTAFW